MEGDEHLFNKPEVYQSAKCTMLYLFLGESEIMSMSASSKYLFVTDMNGNMKMFGV